VRRASLLTLILALAILLPAARAQHNTLNITSQPGGAQVYLDDKPKGATSTDRGKLVLEDLDPGTHELRLSLSGYKDWIQSVTFSEGSTIYVDATLAVPGPAPLSAKDIVDLLRGEVSAKRATVLVKERGVDFDLTEAVEQQIRAAGGGADLLLAITKSKAAPAPSLPPLMPPSLTLLEPKAAEAGKPIEASGAYAAGARDCLSFERHLLGYGQRASGDLEGRQFRGSRVRGAEPQPEFEHQRPRPHRHRRRQVASAVSACSQGGPEA
jgi:hypothetical protein